MSERSILHCDINHCYAQMEEMQYPQLRNVPMVVAGSKADRHGIILAKNDMAKKYHITTAETIHEAQTKCPQLIVIEPDYPKYLYYSELVKDIYRRYSDQVESFGIDEAWIDVSGSQLLFGSAAQIGKCIQKEVWQEIGLSISVGVSFNKIMAKFASDLVKPMGFTVITKENLTKVLYPRPVEELFYVGRATKRKLNSYGIMTIGELADMQRDWLCNRLGKCGGVIWDFAHGIDSSEVMKTSEKATVKSVGNSITAKRDILTLTEAKHVLIVLVESVASRLKAQGLQGKVIKIGLKDNELHAFQRQLTLDSPTNISSEIMSAALKLLEKSYDFDIPLRSIGISVGQCQCAKTFVQFDLFKNNIELEKDRIIDDTMDKIRNKYGFHKVKRCSLLCEEELTTFNPVGDHIIHPVGFFKS